jgi:hypothetical protein
MRHRLLLGFCVLAACGDEMTPDDTPDAGGTVTATFSSLYTNYFMECAECHAPGAPGAGAPGIEMTLNFATMTTAYSTVKNGMATGLTGNQMDCNGVPFVTSTAGTSLILAVLDQPTRQAFDLTTHPNCDVDAITDETVKVGRAPSAQFITALKDWLNAGAPNN